MNIVDLAVFVGNNNFKFPDILLEGGNDDFLFSYVFNFLNFCVFVCQNDLLRCTSFFILFDLGLQLPDSLVLLGFVLSNIFLKVVQAVVQSVVLKLKFLFLIGCIGFEFIELFFLALDFPPELIDFNILDFEF